jgi:hypothetical protein
VRFTERKDFLTDPEVAGRANTATALKLFASYVRAHSAKPPPRFFEVDRSESEVDPLWHTPVSDRIKYKREIDIPAINRFQKPDWKLTRFGITPQRRDDFILAFNILRDLDYFPERGDRVYWNGYRYVILEVVIDPESYWGQTNQWMGLRVECIVPPDGDARPIANQTARSLVELPTTVQVARPLISEANVLGGAK